MIDTEENVTGELQPQTAEAVITHSPVDKDIVLITGGTGFIGTRIIEKLSENYRIVLLDKGGIAPVIAETVFMDVTDQDSIDAALNRVEYVYGTRVASVIHLAAYYDFAGKPSPLYDQVTVQGTKRLLMALRRFEVDQFIFSSSLLVYKPSPKGKKIDEEWPVEPAWDYPKSKVRAENVMRFERGNMQAVMLRIAGVYTDEGNSIPLANHIQRIYEKELTSHFFPGEMEHGNPFVHLDDLVEAIAACVKKRKELQEEVVINIGEEETLSYTYLQNNLGRLIHGKEWKTYRIPRFVAKAGAWVQDLFGDPFIKPWMIDMADDNMELDVSKARQLLDWEPKHSLSETLPLIIEELKKDPKKWYKANKLK